MIRELKINNSLMISLLKRLKKKLLFEIRYRIAPSSYDCKVFCIGFNKTGTTSVGKALELMGYHHTGFNRRVWRNYYLKGRKIDKILRYATKFDAFDDLPWLKEDMIPILDCVFPRSKFIFLERDETSWKESIYNWTYKATGRYPDVGEKLKEYRRHRDFVLHYFRNRNDDFLLINIKDANCLKNIGHFLGKEIEGIEMPHLNKT